MANILVIGGGPAGLSSAIFASTKKNKVTLIERNSSCGKKLLLTGNGKCNYWNEDQSLSHFHSDDASILEQIITPANLEETWEFLKRIGIIPYIRNGYYYNRAMGGSFSIKSVLPAMFPEDPELDYKNLEGVHNGGEAMEVFPLIKDMDGREREETRRNLLRYCALDTYAMVRIWEKLEEVATM